MGPLVSPFPKFEALRFGLQSAYLSIYARFVSLRTNPKTLRRPLALLSAVALTLAGCIRLEPEVKVIPSVFMGKPETIITDRYFNLFTGQVITEEPELYIPPDPAPQALAGTPPFFPVLARQSDCSLTRVILDSNATVQEQDSNYQDFLHNALQVLTTADRFPHGCKEPTTGINSQFGAVVGANGNGQFVAALSLDGMGTIEVSSTGTITGLADYPIDNGNADLFGLAAANLRGGGISDVVVASAATSQSTGALNVFLGNGDGTFKTGQTLSLTLSSAATPVGVTIDDINGDGKLDLVAVTAASSTTSGVTVFLGNGDGTFQTPGISGPSGAGGIVAVTADFNGDGKKDIATSAGQILIGNGDGTFALLPQTLPEGPQPGLAAADFNQDGKVDLAFANTRAATVDVYFGNGNGTFNYSASYAAIDGTTTIEATDLDGDGFPDLFIGTAHGGIYGPSLNSNTFFQSLLNRGNGTFASGQAYFPNQPSQQFDLNPGDAYLQYTTATFTDSGKPDLLMLANGTSGAAFSVLKGNGDGTFSQTAIHTQLSNPSAPQFINAIASGDMNGDGTPDTVFAWNDSTGLGPHLSVALGNGDGTFQTQQDYALPAAVLGGAFGTAHGLVLADLRGTGKPDVVFLAGGLYVMLNNGNGTLATPTLVDSRPSMNFLAAQSLRSNGKADVVVAACNFGSGGTGSTFLYLGNGDGTFQTAAQLNPGFGCPNLAAIADMNGDGKPDLVFAGADAVFNAMSGYVGVFLGNGDGTFQTVKTTAVPAFVGSLPTGIVVTNLLTTGGNGVLLSELGPFGDAFFLPGNGDGTFNTSNASNALLGINGRELQVTDLTGQGMPDLLLTSGGAEANGAQLSVEVFIAQKPAVQPLAGTTTTLRASASTITAGQSLTFTATVTPQSGSGTPTGTVNFLDGTSLIGSGTLNSSGVATFSTSSLTAATHSITASYQGDSTFAASTSSVVSVQVTAATPDFSVSASPSSQTVSRGQSTSYTLTITPSNGFNQAVTISCTGAPTSATCTPANGSVTLDGTSASQDQINVTTTANTMAYRPTRGRWMLAVTFAFLPMIGVLAADLFRHFRLRQRYAWAFLASSILFVLSLGGCGGGKSTSTTGGTPAGTFTLTLTGTSGSATHTTTVSLVVQ